MKYKTFAAVLIAGVLTVSAFTPACAITASANPKEADVSSAAKKIIYTPKRFNEKEYGAASADEKTAIHYSFSNYINLYFFGKLQSSGQRAYYSISRTFEDMTDNWNKKILDSGDSYGDVLLYATAAVQKKKAYGNSKSGNIPFEDPVSRFIADNGGNPPYGAVIYYKDRGEKKRAGDILALKKLIDQFNGSFNGEILVAGKDFLTDKLDGRACKVLLVPGKYSMNDLVKIEGEIYKLVPNVHCTLFNGAINIRLDKSDPDYSLLKGYTEKNGLGDVVKINSATNFG